MCCRACPGYEECRLKQILKDDCCERCPYFEACMEAEPEPERRRARLKPFRRSDVLRYLPLL